MPSKAGMVIVMAAALLAIPAPAAHAAAPSPDPHTLWYDKPAQNWEREALPVGNGAMGAMVFGGVTTERLQLNEKSLWTGGPGSKEGYDHGDWPKPRPGAIDEVRRLIDQNGAMSPDEVSGRLGNPTYMTVGKVPGFGAYQTFGDLYLDLPQVSATGYRRELDLADAVAGVSYGDGSAGYRREYFASYPGNTIIGRLSADQPGKVSFTLRFSSPHAGVAVAAKDGRLTIRGALADNGLVYEGQVRIVTKGGSRTDAGDKIVVKDADSAMLVFSAATNYAAKYPAYRGDDPHARVTKAVDDAAAQPYEKLREAHVRDHRQLFDRVKLDIGQQMPDLTTDRLLAAYRGTTPADRALEALFFEYGRYLLIASSRPGSLPANLQGVWNNSTKPPWEADYHTNINVQMNYWLAELTNLSEAAEPLYDFIDGLREPGRKTARSMFGTDGWVVHQNTNPFGYTGVHDWPTSFWMPEANGWLVQHLYERYLFTRDKAFLRDKAYPAMREAAQFWLKNLYTDPRDGKLVVSPSYSPEQGDFTAGASISQQIVWDLFTNTLEAAKVLGIEEPEIAKALRDLDPGLRVGKWGQLQEWKADLDDPGNQHRHVSHLFGLHPGRQIRPGTPEAAAAKVSLTARGDGGTGWSKAWKINFWSRLRDGDHALKMLGEQLRGSTLPNLWDTHPPFQIDGNFGATSGVAEMLVQSQAGTVDVLPALPSAWAAKGSYDGLRARGDFTVGVTWAQGAPSEIRLASGSGETAKLRSPMFAGKVRVLRADGRPADHTVDGDVLTLPTAAGQSYRIVAQGGVALTLPGTVKPGAAFTAVAVVTATDSKTVPATEVTLDLPDGWTADPASVRTGPLKPGESATASFTVTPGGEQGTFPITATARTDSWSVSAHGKVLVFDPPEVGPRVTDTTTRGDWKGVYGTAGWQIPGFGRKDPAGTVMDTSQAGGVWTWAQTSTEARALQHPTEEGRRIMPSWFTGSGSFTVDTGTASKRVSLYLMDGDGVSGGYPRDQRVTVTDATGKVHDTFTTGRFDQGFWVSWQVKGKVTIALEKLAGANAVSSGIFVD